MAHDHHHDPAHWGRLVWSAVGAALGLSAGAAEVVRGGLQFYPRSEPLLVAQKQLTETLAATASVPAANKTAETPAVSLILLPGNAGDVHHLLGSGEARGIGRLRDGA